jgi:hypothetical protein
MHEIGSYSATNGTTPTAESGLAHFRHPLVKSLIEVAEWMAPPRVLTASPGTGGRLKDTCPDSCSLRVPCCARCRSTYRSRTPSRPRLSAKPRERLATRLSLSGKSAAITEPVPERPLGLVVSSPKGDLVAVGFPFPALPCRALDSSVPFGTGLRKSAGSMFETLSRSAEALLPPHECGGSHPSRKNCCQSLQCGTDRTRETKVVLLHRAIAHVGTPRCLEP